MKWPRRKSAVRTWTVYKSRLCALTLFALCVSTTFCQGTSPSTPQAIELQARSALFATNQPTSIVLDGTFTSAEGSLTQNGSAHLTVGSDGTSLVNLSRSAGPISESRSVSSGMPACTWTDHENVVHNASFLNCLPPAWFFPTLTLLSANSGASAASWTPSSVVSDALGDHLRFQFTLPNSDGTPQDPQLSSPLELVLASDTHLPQYALFTLHPDNPGVYADIPVRVAYSDYRNISGAMIPFHIQRYVNGSLVLDLAITTASVQ